MIDDLLMTIHRFLEQLPGATHDGDVYIHPTQKSVRVDAYPNSYIKFTLINDHITTAFISNMPCADPKISPVSIADPELLNKIEEIYRNLVAIDVTKPSSILEGIKQRIEEFQMPGLPPFGINLNDNYIIQRILRGKDVYTTIMKIQNETIQIEDSSPSDAYALRYHPTTIHLGDPHTIVKLESAFYLIQNRIQVFLDKKR